jgi:hypothetical protein
MCCLPPRLLLQSTANLSPCALPCACRDALFTSVDKTSELEGLVASGGRVNVGRALVTLLGSPASPPQPPTQCAHHKAVAGSCMRHACTTQCRQRSTGHILYSLSWCCVSTTLAVAATLMPLPSSPLAAADSIVSEANIFYRLSWSDAVYDIFNSTNIQDCHTQ